MSAPTAAAGNVKHPAIFYFRVVLSNIPKETPLALLTNPLVPNPQLHPSVKTLLDDFGVTIVSYKMQIFKEAELSTKFGHIDYFLAPVAAPKKSEGEEKEETAGVPLNETTLLQAGKPLVSLFWSWMITEAQGALEIAVPGVKLSLVPGNDLETLLYFSEGQHRDGQSNSYAALPLLEKFNNTPLMSVATDPLKISSYLWSKITILNVEGDAVGEKKEDAVKLQLKLSDIPIAEYFFLQGHLPTIWPKAATSEQLVEFFRAKLSGLCDIVSL